MRLRRVGHGQRARRRERARVDHRGGDRQRDDQADRPDRARLEQRHGERDQRGQDAGRRGERRDDAADVADQQRRDQRGVDRRHLLAEPVDRPERLEQPDVHDDAADQQHGRPGDLAHGGLGDVRVHERQHGGDRQCDEPDVDVERQRDHDQRDDADQREDLVAVEVRDAPGIGGRGRAAGNRRARLAPGPLPLAALEAARGLGLVLLVPHQVVRVDLAAEQLAAAEQEEHDHAQQQVEDERADEQQRRVLLQVRVLDDAVDDRAEDADRREAAGGGAVDDEQAHQHRVDAVLDREPERDRDDDGDGTRDDRAGGGEDRGDEEHHPRDRRRPAADRLNGAVDQPVDRAVARRDREQVRDADEDHEQIAGEPGEDVVLRDAHRRADDERGDDPEHPHVDPGGGRDQEDRDEHEE